MPIPTTAYRTDTGTSRSSTSGGSSGGSGDGTITFSILNYDYSGNTFTATCPAGTTWAEFLESDGNTIGLYIGAAFGSELVAFPSGGYVTPAGSSSWVVPSETIDPTIEYERY